MVFRLGRASAHTLEHIAANAASAEPTYTEVGATRDPQLPPGYRHGRYRVRLPEGPDVFDRAAHGLRSWVPHKGAGLFAYGTLPGHPERGEEAFILKRTDRGVEFTIVAFSEPAELLARAGGPITRRIQETATRRYLGALHDFTAEDERT